MLFRLSGLLWRDLMNKIILAIAVCCGIGGAGGTELVNEGAPISGDSSRVNSLVSSVVKHPENSDDLRELVELLTDQRTGEENSEIAMDRSYELDIPDYTLRQSQVVNMLLSIRGDWRDYGYARSVDYYISGAFSGKFGPYNIPDEVEY